jgi:hypothetical protein
MGEGQGGGENGIFSHLRGGWQWENEKIPMTPFALLLICVAAQILIAAGLGIYLYRYFSRQRKEKEKKDLKQ